MAAAYYYPKTQENQETFKDWFCPVCWGESPEENGGAVAHKRLSGGDGEKHPIHHGCLLDSYKKNGKCPCCNVRISVAALMPAYQRAWVYCKRGGFRSIQAAKIASQNPIYQVALGLFLVCLGLRKKQFLLASVGMGLQAYGIDQAIQKGGAYIFTLQRMQKRAAEVRNALSCYGSFAKKKEFQTLLAHHPQAKAAASWLYSENVEQLISELKKFEAFAQSEINGDRFVRTWRGLAALGALAISAYGVGKWAWAKLNP